jgi:membrane-bound ClpP family serine protease
MAVNSQKTPQWRSLEELDGATTDAIEFAAARGWVHVEGGHIALTEAGRLLAKDLGRI